MACGLSNPVSKPDILWHFLICAECEYFVDLCNAWIKNLGERHLDFQNRRWERPRRRLTTEQIIQHLREAELLLSQGRTIAQVRKNLGITDQTYYRRRKMLNLVDEFMRECLSIDVSRRLTSEDVLERLSVLFVRRGVPECLRSDNCSEFTTRKVRKWLQRVKVQTLFIEPGSPRENRYVESLNGQLRDELLDRATFDTLVEAKALIEH